MKILILSELFYPHGSGAELATWLYVKMLAEEGFKITVVTSKFPNESSFEVLNERIRIYRLPINVMIGTRYRTLVNVGTLMSNLLNKLIKWSDIVYIPGGWFSVIPLVKVHKKPLIVHLHNYSIICPTSLLYDFANMSVGKCSLRSFMLHEYIEKRRSLPSVIASCFINELFGKHYSKLARSADVLIFVSKAQMELILSEIPSLKEKSYMIYNPIPDLPYVKSEQKGIGYLGGKSFVKGFHILIRALKMLRRDTLEAYFTKASKELKRLRLTNGILINLLPKTNLEDVMKKISITVVPSLWPEPLPYALIESMLYGKLIVASNIGGIPEIASNHLSGVKLVKPGDHTEIANALDHFLSLSLEEFNEIGAKNREYVLRKMSNEEILRNFIKILCNAIVNSGQK